MAQRASFSFYPMDDQFTFFSDKIEEEIKATKGRKSSRWGNKLAFLSKAPSVDEASESDEGGISSEAAHELVILSLLAAK